MWFCIMVVYMFSMLLVDGPVFSLVRSSLASSQSCQSTRIPNAIPHQQHCGLDSCVPQTP